MLGKLNPQEIEQMLSDQTIGRIACYNEGLIYLVPLSYAYEHDAVYAHSLNGLKLDVMRKNPSVCFETDNITDMSNWRSVIAWGNFEELTGEEREKALRILITRHLPLNSSSTMHLGKTWPFSAHAIEEIDGIVFRINLTKKTGRFERNSTSDPVID